MSDTTALVRQESRARERSEIERRRAFVARYRWLEANMTAAEIADALRKETPPIIVSVRTIERDFNAIRDDVRRYVNVGNFDARFEAGAALARHELIARTAAKHALTANAADGAKWARVAVLATEAKTRLLQDVNLIDRTIGRLIVDDGKAAERIPSGSELAKRWLDIVVTDAEIMSEAEWHYRHGDATAAEAAARDARDSGRNDS